MRILLLWVVVGLACGCSRKPPEVAVAPDVPPAESTPAAKATDNLPGLLVVLRTGSPERRLDAIAKIVAKGNDDTTTASLLEILGDPACSAEGVSFAGMPHSAREAAVMAMLRLGGEAKTALLSEGYKTLLEGLKDPKPAVREHTAVALGLLLRDGTPAVAGLVALCADASDPVRVVAYESLRKIGPLPVEPFLRLMTHPDPSVAMDAAVAVRTLKPKGRQALKLLIVALNVVPSEEKNPDAGIVVRNAAALAIGGMAAEGEDALDDLIVLLKKTSEAEFARSRSLDEMGAISALRRLGKPAVAKVVPLLSDPDAFVRYQAVVVLGLIGPDAAEALPELFKLVETEMTDLNVVTAAALSVVQMGGDAAKPVVRLTALLSDERPEVQRAVARSIRGLGRAAGAAPVVPLMAILENPETTRGVRAEVIGALRALGPVSKPAIPLLVLQMTRTKFDDVKLSIVETLGEFGAVAVEAVPALRKALEDRDDSLRQAALRAVTAIGPAAKEVEPVLLKMLVATTANPRSHMPVFAALAAIRADSPAAIPLLMDFLSEADVEHRRATVEALGRHGSGSPAVRERLLTMAQKDSRTDSRLAAVRAIARMKTPASAPMFRTIIESKNADMAPWAHAGLILLAPDRAAIAALEATIRDRSPRNTFPRMQAIEAASLLGDAAAPLLPALGEALKEMTPVSAQDKSGDKVRDRALRTISALGSSAAPLAMALDQQIRDNSGDYRRRAIVAAGTMGPGAKALQARLREAIRLDPTIAAEAWEALDRIGN